MSLEVCSLKSSWETGERCKLPNGVWGVEQAVVEFGAF